MLKRFRHVILSIVAGIVLALALPRPGWPIMAWIGLAPLFIALRGSGVRRAALCGLIAALTYSGIIFYWVTLFGWLPWLLVTLIEALFVGLFAILYVRLSPERVGWMGFLAVPSAWVAMQFARTLGPYAFDFGSLAHTQANVLPIAQIASITGPWGIDFAVCFVNLALATAVIDPVWRPRLIFAAICVPAALCAYGYVTMQSPLPHGPSHKVAIVQGNLRSYADVADAYAVYSRLTITAAAHRPDIIVWPETAIACDLTSPGWKDSVTPLAKRANCDLLAGAYDPPCNSRLKGSYNALFLFDKTGRTIATYRKAHLVPFGEFVPLRDKLPFLKDYGVRPEDVRAAREHTLLPLRIGKLGVSICFESLFPAISRSEVKRGAQALCVVTNDSWFEQTPAGMHHLMMARLRAIETRRCVIRAATTGISASIDPYGRIRRELGQFRSGVLYDTVTTSRSITPYTRLGDWLAYLSIGLAVICLFVPARAQKSLSAGHPRET